MLFRSLQNLAEPLDDATALRTDVTSGPRTILRHRGTCRCTSVELSATVSVTFWARAIYRNFLTVAAPLFDDSESEKEEGSDPATSERQAYETGAYASGIRARRSRTLSGNDPVVLPTKMRSLSVRGPSYLVLYSQCQRQFHDIPQNLPISELFQAPAPSSVFFYSTPPKAASATGPPSYPSTPTIASTISDSKSAFFRNRNSA